MHVAAHRKEDGNMSGARRPWDSWGDLFGLCDSLIHSMPKSWPILAFDSLDMP